MKKRFLTMLVALAACLALIPTANLATVEKTDDGFIIYNDTTLHQYTGKDSHVVIPSGITTIEGSAFPNNEKVTSVIIPEGVVGIENFAFSGCKNLTSVSFPDSLRNIGYFAFTGCENLANINLPNGVQNLGGGAFNGCAATSVTIPASVTNIGYAPFAVCHKLTSIEVDPGNRNFTSVDGTLFSQDMKTIVNYPAGKQNSSYTIPAGVTSIGLDAFYGCENLTGVTIPDSVTSIGNGAFSLCFSLTSIVIPSGVTSISHEAFYACEALSSVTIPSSVTSIEKSAFWQCKSLTSVTIPSSVTKIGESAFTGNSLKDVYYTGTKSQWDSIEISEYYNDDLNNAAIHYNSAALDQPDTSGSTNLSDSTKGVSAAPTNDKLTVNNYAATPAAYKINDANYFKLRDVAALLSFSEAQFSVEYDEEKNAVIILTNQPYEPIGGELEFVPTSAATATVSNDAVYIDGVKADLTAYKIDGSNYYGLRELGKTLDFNVGWAPERGMFIESNKPYSDAD